MTIHLVIALEKMFQGKVPNASLLFNKLPKDRKEREKEWEREKVLSPEPTHTTRNTKSALQMNACYL